MLKRFLWLVLSIIGGWIVWLWLRRRRNDAASVPAQLASSQAAAPQTSLFEPMIPVSPTAPDEIVVLDESGIATEVELAADATTADTIADMGVTAEDESQQSEPLASAANDDEQAVARLFEDHEPPAQVNAREAGAAIENERPPEADDRDIPISAEGPGGVVTAAPDTQIDSSSDASTTSTYTPVEFTPIDQAAGTVENTTTGELHGITAYCFRCKAKRVIDHAHEEITESGRRGARGTCPVCGTSIFTFLSDDASNGE